MNEDGFPEWLRPPCEGFTSDDLFRLTDLPPHTQLIDGSLVPRARQSVFHSMMNRFLMEELVRICPDQWDVVREMVVICGPRQALEPDVAVVRSEACTDPDIDRFRAEDVRFVVETVMPDSEIRDWERKPHIYAQAGIKYLWIITQGKWADRVQVNAYELDPATKSYGTTGIYHDQLKATVPFDVDIDFAQYDRRR